MHPPDFGIHQRLSDWPSCFFELHCCKGTVLHPVKLALLRHGDQSFDKVVGKFRCGICGKRPAPVYLCATHHRSLGHGAPVNWAVELVSPNDQPAFIEERARICIEDQI